MVVHWRFALGFANTLKHWSWFLASEFAMSLTTCKLASMPVVSIVLSTGFKERNSPAPIRVLIIRIEDIFRRALLRPELYGAKSSNCTSHQGWDCVSQIPQRFTFYSLLNSF